MSVIVQELVLSVESLSLKNDTAACETGYAFVL